MMIAPTPFFGDRGCHVRILEEIRALDEAGVRVLLLTYPAGKDVAGVDIRRLRDVGWRSGERVGPDVGKFFLDAVMFFAALREAKRFGPNIIHGHLHEGCLIGRFVGGFLGIPVVFDYQGSLSGEMAHHGFFRRSSLPFAAFRRIEKFIDNLPKLVLVSSGCMLRREAGGHSVPWRVAPDAVDVDIFRPFARDDELAQRLELPRNKPVCVFLGLLNRYQGVDLLLESIAAMKKKYGPKVHFLAMGYPGVEYYTDRAAALGIDDCVTFPGRVPYEDAPRFLNLGDLAVAPKIAVTESNGKIVDYMACRLPTVALDTATNRELLGDAGYYVPWRGSETLAAPALAEAVAALADDESLRDKLGEMGRDRVVKLFNRKNLAEGLLAAYESVLGK